MKINSKNLGVNVGSKGSKYFFSSMKGTTPLTRMSMVKYIVHPLEGIWINNIRGIEGEWHKFMMGQDLGGNYQQVEIEIQKQIWAGGLPSEIRMLSIGEALPRDLFELLAYISREKSDCKVELYLSMQPERRYRPMHEKIAKALNHEIIVSSNNILATKVKEGEESPVKEMVFDYTDFFHYGQNNDDEILQNIRECGWPGWQDLDIEFEDIDDINTEHLFGKIDHDNLEKQYMNPENNIYSTINYVNVQGASSIEDKLNITKMCEYIRNEVPGALISVSWVKTRDTKASELSIEEGKKMIKEGFLSGMSHPDRVKFLKYDIKTRWCDTWICR